MFSYYRMCSLTIECVLLLLAFLDVFVEFVVVHAPAVVLRDEGSD